MRRETGTAEITAQLVVELQNHCCYFLLDVIRAGVLSILPGVERSP